MRTWLGGSPPYRHGGKSVISSISRTSGIMVKGSQGGARCGGTCLESQHLEGRGEGEEEFKASLRYLRPCLKTINKPWGHPPVITGLRRLRQVDLFESTSEPARTVSKNSNINK